MNIIPLIRDFSILLAAWTAIYGIDSWRREFGGKRDIELAEEVLALFYEARDAIASIRSPFGYEGEGNSRKAIPDETPEQKEARNRAFIVFERYEKHSELFSRLHASRYRFMARFGRDLAQPFDEIRKALTVIRSSSPPECFQICGLAAVGFPHQNMSRGTKSSGKGMSRSSGRWARTR